jgi:hypothetical protein
MKTTPAQHSAAVDFAQAFDDFKACTAATRAAADRQLDLAADRYRKAYGLSSAMGLLDLINHFNSQLD